MGSYYSKGSNVLYFDSLPTDLKKLLLCYVPYEALDICKLTSFSTVSLDDHYWKKLYQNEFSQCIPETVDCKYYFDARKRWFNTIYSKYTITCIEVNLIISSQIKLSVVEGWEKKLSMICLSMPDILSGLGTI